VEITFQNTKDQSLFNSEKELKREYGEVCAKKIRRRLDDLQAAPTLENMRNLPGRCHELKGDMKFQLSLDVEHPLRLIFMPVGNGFKFKDDGGLDWKTVTEVQIIGVVDTHE
jgi:plasmid maintenance system killer protein